MRLCITYIQGPGSTLEVHPQGQSQEATTTMSFKDSFKDDKDDAAKEPNLKILDFQVCPKEFLEKKWAYMVLHMRC